MRELSLQPVDGAPSTRPTHAVRQRAALAVMLVSGWAALGYQIVWTQQCAVWLGHELPAVLAVVGAYFGGLALGALLLGQRVARSPRPARWFMACELAVAGWSAVLALLMGPAGAALVQLLGEQPAPLLQWSVAFGATFLLLLPASLAMGATLPAMERMAAAWQHSGSRLPALYAANTAGACAGVLAAAFWMVPHWGLSGTAMACAALNLSCAAAVALLDRGAVHTGLAPALTSLNPAAPKPAASRRRAAALLASTGCLGIGYEVLVVRVLSQVAENTVYTYALALAVYLVGTALGAAAYQRWATRVRSADALQALLLQGLALSCLAGMATLWGAEATLAAGRAASGGGMAGALLGEAAAALAAFLLPTIAMGALFSHLALQARQCGLPLGPALAANTAGAALAPLLFGVGLAPLLGARGALLLVCVGYLLPGLRRIGWMAALTGLALAGLALWAPPLVFIDVPEGGRVLSYREGALAAVSVVEDAQGVARLRIDNRQQEGSSSSLLADARQALLPLLLHPAPRHALFLGLGTGMTASAAALDRQLQVDAVELLPEVIEAAAQFRGVFGSQPPPLNVMAADARRYVRATARRYDLIVADNFHPARSGSAALYTVEHFRAVQHALAPGGLFCQWLPLHQLDLQTLRSIVQSYRAVFPGALAMLATYSLRTPVIGLVARGDGGRIDAAAVHARVAGLDLAGGSAAFGLPDEQAVLGSWIAGPAALAQLAGDAPLNTDDRPVVAYLAPRITYASDSSPGERLLALLQHSSITAEEGLVAGTAAAWRQHLADYRQARNRYLETGLGVQPLADARQMLDQVRAPLLDVLRISPEFTPAYQPLLRLAQAWAQQEPLQAQPLLAELAQVQARAEARRAALP